MPEASPGISLAARVALVSYTIIVTLAIGLIVTRDPHSSTVLGFVHSAVISSPPRWVGANESTAQRVGVTARHHQSLRGAPQALTQQALPRTSSQQQDSAQASKRGVLIVSAGEQLLSAYVNLKVLRDDLHSTLPVEVVYFGPAEAPPPHVAAALRSLSGVRLIDGSSHRQSTPASTLVRAASETNATRPPTKPLGFLTKIHALVNITSFDEVLLLDSDNLPLMRPEALFDSPQYKQAGNLFWPDWWHPFGTVLAVQPALYTSLGLEVPWKTNNPTTFHCTESGQVIFNRGRYRDVLDRLWWLTTQPSVTALAHGDKDLYRVAFALANKSESYQQVSLPARSAAGKGDDSPSHLNFMGMVQLSPLDARPAFHHRTGPTKYIPHYASSIQAASRGKLDRAMVSHLSAPLSHHEAYRVVGRYWWYGWEVDTDAWRNRNCSYQHPPTVYAGTSRPDVPELWCYPQAGTWRISMYPLKLFSDASYYIHTAHRYMNEFLSNHTQATGKLATHTMTSAHTDAHMGGPTGTPVVGSGGLHGEQGLVPETHEPGDVLGHTMTHNAHKTDERLKPVAEAQEPGDVLEQQGVSELGAVLPLQLSKEEHVVKTAQSRKRRMVRRVHSETYTNFP